MKDKNMETIVYLHFIQQRIKYTSSIRKFKINTKEEILNTNAFYSLKAKLQKFLSKYVSNDASTVEQEKNGISIYLYECYLNDETEGLFKLGTEYLLDFFENILTTEFTCDL